MREEIIDMLIYEDYNALHDKYGLPIFVSKMLCFAYKMNNSTYHRNMLVGNIQNGYYSNLNEIKSMAYSFISKSILYSPDHGKSILIESCGLTEIEAQELINDFIKHNENLKDLLSAELDVSNTNIEMRDMIYKHIDSFLASTSSIQL